MKVIRRNAKLASVFLTILMLSITIPYQSALAAMIGREAMLDSTRSQQARNDINSLLLWETKVLSVSLAAILVPMSKAVANNV